MAFFIAYRSCISGQSGWIHFIQDSIKFDESDFGTGDRYFSRRTDWGRLHSNPETLVLRGSVFCKRYYWFHSRGPTTWERASGEIIWCEKRIENYEAITHYNVINYFDFRL